MAPCALVVFLCILFANSSVGLQVFLEVSPATIQPILTKQLQMRCSVKSDFPMDLQKQTSQHESFDGVTPGCDSATQASSPMLSATSTSRRADATDLLSIVITKHSLDHKKRDIIANVTNNASPNIGDMFPTELLAEGSCDSSNAEELGHLLLTVTMPADKHAGNYTCEVLVLDSQKIPIALNASFSIKALQPSMSGLVAYITSTLEKDILVLKKQVSDLTDSNNKLMEHIEQRQKMLQSGRSTLCQNNRNSWATIRITFEQAFPDTPVVFIKITEWGHLKKQHFEAPANQNTLIEDIFPTFFEIDCFIDSYEVLEFEWLAVG